MRTAKKALLLVDIQNDFMPGGPLAVPDGDRVVPVANDLIRSGAFDVIVATQDWHPPDHGSFASQHPGRKPGDEIELHGLVQTLWPDHCVQETRGAEFHPDLAADRIDRVFRKGTDREVDSYSGFFDNGKRHATGLGDELAARGVGEVHIVGLAMDVCVRATALDAAALGYDTRVHRAGVRAVNLHEGDEQRTGDELRRAGVQIV